MFLGPRNPLRAMNVPIALGHSLVPVEVFGVAGHRGGQAFAADGFHRGKPSVADRLAYGKLLAANRWAIGSRRTDSTEENGPSRTEVLRREERHYRPAASAHPSSVSLMASSFR